MAFDPETGVPGARIKVIGIGGGGGNAVNTMIRTSIEGVEFITANTDLQALRSSLSPTKIQVGRELTKGLGAGADPDIGRDAALEDRHAIQSALEGADMVFITAGMGGGTGTGGAAVIAQIARELGALTVGVVTKPFAFEGKRRKRHADIGIARLREHVDTLITIPNQRLLQLGNPELSMIEAFRMADNVLVNAVKGISDIINVPGVVNVDFADVKTVMSSMGLALMGTGVSEGPERATEAARQAINSPLLEDVNIEGATGILVNIVSGKDITLKEVHEACSIIQEAAHEDANIIFGAVIDENLGNEMRVTVIATGFPSEEDQEVETPQSRGRSFQQQSRQSSFVRPRDERSFAVKAPEKNPFAGLPVYATEGLRREPQISSADTMHELTRMTFDSGIDAESAATNEPILAADEIAAQNLDNWTAPKVSGAYLDHEEKRTVTPVSPMIEPPMTVTESERWQNLAGATVSDENPSAFMQQRSALDRKIDEALQRVERVKREEPAMKGGDDLDVPAFLRHGMKDLSLS